MNFKLKYYKNEAAKTTLADSDPYQVIQLLMAGTMDSLSLAKGAIERNDYETKGKALAQATTIIESLRASLDFKASAEISQNLHDLYTYMLDRLVEATVARDSVIIEEVADIFREIKSAWDMLPPEARQDAEKQRMQLASGE